MQNLLNQTFFVWTMWLCVQSKLFTINNFFQSVWTPSQVPLQVWALSCVSLKVMLNSIAKKLWIFICPSIVISEVWTKSTLYASISHWNLVDCESQPTTLCWMQNQLRATSTACLGCHLLVIASQLLIAMYTTSRWLYFYLANMPKNYCLSLCLLQIYHCCQRVGHLT